MAVKAILDKAELNARLLRIQPVSWDWNWKGLLLHASNGQFFKHWRKREQGVISQQVRDELADAYPDIVIMKSGVLHVDYGLLANLAYENLSYLDSFYRRRMRAAGRKPALDMKQLRDQATDVNDPQGSVVRLLLLTRTYNRRLTDILSKAK